MVEGSNPFTPTHEEAPMVARSSVPFFFVSVPRRTLRKRRVRDEGSGGEKGNVLLLPVLAKLSE